MPVAGGGKELMMTLVRVDASVLQPYGNVNRVNVYVRTYTLVTVGECLRTHMYTLVTMVSGS